MKILLLAKGDPETHDSWSGVSRSVLTHLRALGNTVRPGDVELYGAERYLTAARTLSLSRRRWWVRYHLGTAGFEARSRRSDQLVNRAGDLDVLFQVGATFQSSEEDVPLALYCDSTIALSKRGASSGYSEVSALSPREYDEILGREARIYQRADLIFCMSDLLRRTFIEDFDVPPERLVTIHCAPNAPIPDVVERRGDASRPPTVLFVGRDWGRKGGALLMEAFPSVRRRVPGARLRLVGSKPSGAVPSWVDCVGVQSRDTAEGRRVMNDVYLESDAFCLASRFEPFGTSFVEAMAYQLPCIGPDAWAVPEIIEDGRTGVLFDPGSSESLAGALVRVLSDPDKGAEMGRAGRRRALDHFTWPGIAARISTHLQRLVSPARGPGYAAS